MSKEELENIYDAIEKKRDEMRITEKQVQKLDREIMLEVEKYRNQSVCRVLDYINNKCWKKENIDNLQILIVHCMNKLNGNIDGTELSLEESK